MWFADCESVGWVKRRNKNSFRRGKQKDGTFLDFAFLCGAVHEGFPFLRLIQLTASSGYFSEPVDRHQLFYSLLPDFPRNTKDIRTQRREEFFYKPVRIKYGVPLIQQTEPAHEKLHLKWSYTALVLQRRSSKNSGACLTFVKTRGIFMTGSFTCHSTLNVWGQESDVTEQSGWKSSSYLP